MQTVISKNKVPVKIQALAAVFATVSAVVLPQLFHLIGRLSGSGAVPGETFLPMHLPVILVGFLAGPLAGALTGLLSPVISFALTGMPQSAMLPFMALELLSYGFFAGLLRETRMNTVLKVTLVQLSGRTVRAAAILLSVYIFKSNAIPAAIILKSIAAGLPGLILQWTLLPLILFRIENRGKNDEQ